MASGVGRLSRNSWWDSKKREPDQPVSRVKHARGGVETSIFSLLNRFCHKRWFRSLRYHFVRPRRALPACHKKIKRTPCTISFSNSQKARCNVRRRNVSPAYTAVAGTSVYWWWQKQKKERPPITPHQTEEGMYVLISDLLLHCVSKDLQGGRLFTYELGQPKKRIKLPTTGKSRSSQTTANQELKIQIWNHLPHGHNIRSAYAGPNSLENPTRSFGVNQENSRIPIFVDIVA